MPWPEVNPMNVRRSFVEDWLTDAWTMVALCADYRVSRKTAYKWLARFEVGGWPALRDQSRRPHAHPGATSARVCAAVCAAQQQKPLWGPRKIRAWLVRQHPEMAWPSRVTIAAIWQRAQLRPPPRRRRRVPASGPLTAAAAPNDVWSVDFKGDFRLGDGSRCHPLTLRDVASRFTLACCALTEPDQRHTQRQFARAFARYGLPRCVRSDNGPPFAGQGLHGLSQLTVWWMRHGIRVEHIAPGRPDQNGAHEQFHRVLKAATTRPPAASRRAQQHRFDHFVREYNEERPHEALADAVPAEGYCASPRPWPRRVPPLEYPGHWEPRRVQPNGGIRWQAQHIFLSRALAGHDVALEEVDDGVWTIHFATVPLARWLARGQHLRSLPIT
jgi:transposase InsO family protein